MRVEPAPEGLWAWHSMLVNPDCAATGRCRPPSKWRDAVGGHLPRGGHENWHGFVAAMVLPRSATAAMMPASQKCPDEDRHAEFEDVPKVSIQRHRSNPWRRAGLRCRKQHYGRIDDLQFGHGRKISLRCLRLCRGMDRFRRRYRQHQEEICFVTVAVDGGHVGLARYLDAILRFAGSTQQAATALGSPARYASTELTIRIAREEERVTR